MKTKSDSYKEVSVIINDLREGLSGVKTAYLSKIWNQRVTKIKNDFDAFESSFKSRMENQGMTLARKKSRHLEMNSVASTEAYFDKATLTTLNELMLDTFQLLFSFRYKNIQLSSALLSYIKFITSSYIELLDKYETLKVKSLNTLTNEEPRLAVRLTGHQLSLVYRQLYEGSINPSKIAYFQPRKKSEKKSLEKSLETIYENRKEDVLKRASESLAVDIKTQIKFSFEEQKHKLKNNIDFELVSNDKKIEYFETFYQCIIKLLDLQKEFPLNACFGEAVTLFIDAIIHNHQKYEQKLKLMTAKISQDEFLISYQSTLSSIMYSKDKPEDKIALLQTKVPALQVGTKESKKEETPTQLRM